MVVGEETVEPAAGEDTDTVTPAEATALVNSGRTNSEKARLNFPSWSLMGPKSSRGTWDYDSTLCLKSSRN